MAKMICVFGSLHLFGNIKSYGSCVTNCHSIETWRKLICFMASTGVKAWECTFWWCLVVPAVPYGHHG